MKDRCRVVAASMSDNVCVVESVEGIAAGVALVDNILLRVL